MNDKPKSKWRWQLLRRGLIILAVFATLIAILVTEENWRGKHDWYAYKHAAEARGEQFDWTALTPTVSTNETLGNKGFPTNLTVLEIGTDSDIVKINGTNLNEFFKTKSADKWVNDGEFRLARSDGTWPTNDMGGWQEGKMTDLKNWQTYYRSAPTNFVDEFPIAPQAQSAPADVLLALSKFSARIKELHSATGQSLFHFGGRKPDAQFMMESLDYFSEFRGRVQVIQLRAIAELANGEGSNAMEDIQLLLRLDRAVCEEPLLIAHLVGIAETAITLQPIYEGLARHSWNDVQLGDLEQDLSSINFLSNYQFAMAGERAFAVEFIEDERITHGIRISDIESGKFTGKTDIISLRWTPSAFFYQSELAFAQMYDRHVLPLVDVTNHTISLTAYRANENSYELTNRSLLNPYTILARLTFSSVSKAIIKFARIQTDVDLARVACALERYRLSHNNYPETLDLLAPQYIDQVPHDVINGQPLHYHRTDDGKFILYSVGWNATDDGGTVALTKFGGVNSEQGDWVWKY